jgi:DNA-binding NtrC family response regulator
VLTQYGTIDSADAATRMGAVDYVTKPFHIDDLRARQARESKRKNRGTSLSAQRNQPFMHAG